MLESQSKEGIEVTLHKQKPTKTQKAFICSVQTYTVFQLKFYFFFQEMLTFLGSFKDGKKSRFSLIPHFTGEDTQIREV